VIAAALRTVEESGVEPDALVFTGDLADHGAPEEYQRLRALLEPSSTPARGARRAAGSRRACVPTCSSSAATPPRRSATPSTCGRSGGAATG